MKKGVYTIEAAVWVSLLLSIFMIGILSGLHLYQEAAQQEISEDIADFQAVESFYLRNGIEGVWND